MSKEKEVLTKRYSTGAGLDQRTQEQKDKDYRPDEAFASGAVQWRQKTLEEIEANIKATSISQGATSRCVSEYAGIALEQAENAETGKRIVFSRKDIYCRRANRPFEGMSMQDLFKLMQEGACLESQLPSTALTEKEINSQYEVTEDMVTVRKRYSAGSSFTWDKYTIDNVANMIDQGIPVCLFWYFDNAKYNEYWKPNPQVLRKVDLYASDTARHQATAIDYTLNGEGEKCLVLMDSSGQGTGLGKQRNLRFANESFFMARCYGAGFTIDKKNLDYSPDKLAFKFLRDLEFGDTGHDVEALQKILVLEGCIQIKAPTGKYFGLTQAGVKKLQEKYTKEILTPVRLKQGTGFFGIATRQFINKKYSA